jgi:ABC-type transporter Mla subunit MlaD
VPKERTALTDAIQQVNEVIQTLKDALDDLDEVLETLELAERQKAFDEGEIESLKRSLRMLQRPREQGRGPR